MLHFLHSGAIGDIIYSLPTVRALGGGHIYIRTADHGDIRGRFSEADISSIAPLLAAQPYVSGVSAWKGEREVTPLDLFRIGRYEEHENLADLHLLAWGLDRSERDKAWISAKPNRVAPVVFARSLRYRGHPAFWPAAMATYRRRAVFVGTEEEHDAIQAYGRIDWHRTKTMLDVAEVIAGADVFVGNQSAPYAVAEGLKKTAVLEAYLLDENCRFDRPGVKYVTGDTEILQYISPFPGPEVPVPSWP